MDESEEAMSEFSRPLQAGGRNLGPRREKGKERGCKTAKMDRRISGRGLLEGVRFRNLVA
jgi:hypothetical protein